MNTIKIILGLVPFALFSLLAHELPVGWAALIGAATAIILLLSDLRHGVKLVPAAGILVLGAFAAIGFLAGPGAASVLADFGRGLATLVLALLILATAKVAPFTAAYARETVQKQYWTSDRFLSSNRRISLAWGLSILAMAASHLIAETLAVGGVDRPILDALLNWGVPIYAILTTVKYTKRISGDDSRPAPAAA
jgi:hypothetical protein